MYFLLVMTTTTTRVRIERVTGLPVLAMSRSVVVVDKPAELRSVSAFGPTKALLAEHARRVAAGASVESLGREFERASRRERFCAVAADTEGLPAVVRQKAAHLPRTKDRFLKFCKSSLSYEEADAAWNTLREAVRAAEARDGLEESDSVLARIKALFPEACPVHRLDKATSGVLAVALESRAASHLSKQWANREVEKRYDALVDGIVGPDEGVVDLPLLRVDAPRRSGLAARMLVDYHDDPRAKACHTEFKVIRRHRRDSTTHLHLVPRTGRLHQLRAHLAAIGHPILGDDMYGIKKTASRLCLHAKSLDFVDPDSGDRWHIVSPPDWGKNTRPARD
ncbi:hypothetical protein CTAYLR_005660 [Chrysophaeum taylorii]|uniref:Pseudouridine synthase RsuA/RluA-like domain-containing protein n=1 Tax=Chrysophaeum taylorii TaxID=2483200 RepID=A0AAD7UKV2_9STRA|nr:hypothetical protein CTAYLR_005660 [Chrysophaeum taylorii]